ncbi:hypothetical protein Hanom_Chr10g00960021 [Helianthus anomalus]
MVKTHPNNACFIHNYARYFGHFVLSHVKTHLYLKLSLYIFSNQGQKDYQINRIACSQCKNISTRNNTRAQSF